MKLPLVLAAAATVAILLTSALPLPDFTQLEPRTLGKVFKDALGSVDTTFRVIEPTTTKCTKHAFHHAPLNTAPSPHIPPTPLPTLTWPLNPAYSLSIPKPQAQRVLPTLRSWQALINELQKPARRRKERDPAYAAARKRLHSVKWNRRRQEEKEMTRKVKMQVQASPSATKSLDDVERIFGSSSKS